MRHSMKALWVLAFVAAMSAGVAWAGFIQGSVGVQLANQAGHGHGGPPSWAGPPDFVFNLRPDDSGNGKLGLKEDYKGPETLGHVIAGMTDQDPIMNIVKEISNDSGFEWIGFELALPDENGIVFTGTPTSDQLTLISQEDYKVVFGMPGSVTVGETMVLDFDVLVPSTGPFSFTLTQTPIGIPEPSVLVMLLIGGAALLVRRR